MTNKKTAVFGIYPTVSHAERAVDALIASNFSNGRPSGFGAAGCPHAAARDFSTDHIGRSAKLAARSLIRDGRFSI